MEKNKSSISNVKRVRIGYENAIGIVVIILLCFIWFIVSKKINKQLILPDFIETIKQFWNGWFDNRTMTNMKITLVRVLLGVFYAMIVGTILGLSMGFSKNISNALSPLVNSIRQIPIMAWVPLSIIWFGLGEGPTVFLIFMSAVFPLTINTIAGVANIDENYINAAKSMGADSFHLYTDVIIPGALPSFLTGCRLAVSSGWQSVICAEFIATSSGFGFIMIEAQERLQTSKLYALMIMSAVVGFLIDKIIRIIETHLTSWRYKDGAK